MYSYIFDLLLFEGLTILAVQKLDKAWILETYSI